MLVLVREGEGGAAEELHTLGVGLDKARAAIEAIVGRGERGPVGEIGITPRARAVIELAADEARRLGHRVVGTEHLLLRLLRGGQGIGVGALESLGVNVETLRLRTIEIAGRGTGGAAARLIDAEAISPTFGERAARPGSGGACGASAPSAGCTPWATGRSPPALEEYERGFVLTLLLPATDPSSDAPVVAAEDDRGVGYRVVHGSRGGQGDA